MKRTISIWDLPIENIYIKLKSKFAKKFFNQAHNKFGSWSKVGKAIGIKRGDTLIASDWRSGRTCYPLYYIFRIAELTNISKDQIENNIIEIKSKSLLRKRGGNGGKPIIFPKLPIKINENFIEILGHICGDGCISRSNPKKGVTLKYINSEESLLEAFNEKIKNVFGEIKPNVQIRNGGRYRRDNFCLQYPTILSLYILSVFDCLPGDQKRFPKILSKLSDKKKCCFLRALFDDEGSVVISDKSISIGLKPKISMEEIRQILFDLGFSPSKIRFTSRIHRLKIARQKDILLYKKLIGFKHPTKAEKLNLILEKGWKFERYRDGEIKDKILQLLMENNSLNTKEIADILNRKLTTVRKHLNKIKEEGNISCKIFKPYYLWSLNE